MQENDTAKSLLEAKGIRASEIKYIIISHFHADHISGLKDFPDAQLICRKDAFEEVNELAGWKAVRKGILHKLLPADLKSKLILLEDFADQMIVNEYGFTEYQVFGIRQFRLVHLPGHAKGMLGFIYCNHDQSIFMAPILHGVMKPIQEIFYLEKLSNYFLIPGMIL